MMLKHGRNLSSSFGLQSAEGGSCSEWCYAHITKSTGSTEKINPHNKEATLTQQHIYVILLSKGSLRIGFL